MCIHIYIYISRWYVYIYTLCVFICWHMAFVSTSIAKWGRRRTPDTLPRCHMLPRCHVASRHTAAPWGDRTHLSAASRTSSFQFQWGPGLWIVQLILAEFGKRKLKRKDCSFGWFELFGGCCDLCVLDQTRCFTSALNSWSIPWTWNVLMESRKCAVLVSRKWHAWWIHRCPKIPLVGWLIEG